MDDFRIEHDSMGEVKVPKDALWGAQTQRAVENFPISGYRVDQDILRALALIKQAAAFANGELGLIAKEVSSSIVSAAADVAENKYSEHFPVDVFQTGSGTSTNMNMNEVIARIVSDQLGKEIRPNDEPNASQSSNDVFPSAIHLACLEQTVRNLLPSLETLARSFENKADEFKSVVKTGRTHLMDATPVTLGQEFSGYAAQIKNAILRISGTLSRVGELPLGGTAVGTGINAPKEFAPLAISKLREITGLELKEAPNHFEAQGARDGLCELSGQLKVLAVSLYKIANDLRWMASGPRCGLGEIHLPDLQPGSSIMPGKVNPVVPEAVCQVVAQVFGNDAAVSFGAAAGNFELNVMLPVIGRNLLESIKLLAAVTKALAEKCVDGIVANIERCRTYALSSPSIGTALNPYIGYEKAAEVIKKALAENKDLRQVVLELGYLSENEVDVALDVEKMTQGGIIK
jgi:fumarate hydratase class II